MRESSAACRCVLVVLALAEPAPASAAEAPMPPFVLDCGASRGDGAEGPEEEGERRGRDEARRRPATGEPLLARLPDARYSARRGYGHEGGEGFRRWFAGQATIWGRPEPDLFASGRSSPESYRFDLPAGRYVVAVGLCELEEHVRGRRVFDVAFQGETVRRGVDPFAIAGYGQSFRLVRDVDVREEEGLTVGFRRGRRSRRAPFVNAIWVYPSATGEGTGATVDLRGFGSYGMNALFWDHLAAPDVVGYVIERCAPGEAVFRALTPEPVPVARWIDHDASARTASSYRVVAVDVRGRRGPPSAALSLAPREVGDAAFPVYALTVRDEDLTALYRNVHEERSVDAVLRSGGVDYRVRLRIRGAVSRFAAKLSYHVTFLEETPFGDRRVIYLKAEPTDYTMQQLKLSSDIFSALGVPAGTARYVTLLINGRYQGIYLDVERVDRAFLERMGLRGALFRAGSFQHLGAAPGRKRGGSGSKKALDELVRAINRVDRGEFESFVRSETDWPRLRDYFVANTLCHRSEIEADDYFYAQLSGQRWILIPWDSNGNFGVAGAGLVEPFVPLFGQTLQGSGHWNDYWHVLPSRIFHQRSLREDYLDRIERLVEDWLVSRKVDGLIDANFASLRSQAVVDPYRWPPGKDAPFERSAGELRRFVRQHAARLLELVRAERHRPRPDVVMSEFQLAARGGWVEIHNRSGASVPLRGWSIGRLDGAYRPWHRFGAGERLEPGAFRVVTVEYAPRTRLAGELRGAEWLEELERAELEGREPPEREPTPAGPPLPGGTVALLGALPARDGTQRGGAANDREPESFEAAEARPIDWYFFGHQTPGFSYGRCGSGFAFLRPTPGEVNGTEGFAPPGRLADGGSRGRRGGEVVISALIAAGASGGLPRSVVLHYSFGAAWREVAMTIDAAAREPRRAVASVQSTTATTDIWYYFVARSDVGIERRAPLTAPLETYHHRLRRRD